MKEGCVIKTAAKPGAAEMEEINRYTRRAYGPEEVYTFSLVLCDNEIDRDFERFGLESLARLKELFLGRTCILDHELKSANQTARIYHTELDRVEGQMTQAGEPLTRLTAKAYLPKTESTKETRELIDSGILKEVSVSCSVKRTVCGICGKERCDHEKGGSYGGRTGHRVLLEPTDAYECSFVAVPAQRGAGVTKGRTGEDRTVEKLLGEPPQGGVRLSGEQARELNRRFRELEERAAWGKEYRRELEEAVVKYSGILQPEVPRAVMESAVKGLDMDQLGQMKRAYARMAGRRMPLSPQLAAEAPVCKDGENGAFRI